jgi:MFS family permease
VARPRSNGSTRRVPIFALLGANAISWVGNIMTSVAVPWFVLETTGSAARTGLTGAAIGVGTVMAAFFGGPVVDRLGFKRTSVLADLMSGVTVALVPLLFWADALAFCQLLLLVFLGSVLDAPGRSAREALIPDLSRSAGMPIERANSADTAIPRFAQFLGPPLAGVLIVVLGASNVLLVDAATFTISAILIVVGVPSSSRLIEEMSPEDSRGYFTQLLQGLRFVRGNMLIISMILVATVANLLDTTLVSVILPVYAKTVYGSAVSLGVMLGAFGAGALVGTVLFGAVGHHLPRRLTFILCFTAVPLLSYLTLAAMLPLPVIVGAFALGGLIAGPINPLYMTVVQEHTPREMRGRVFGVLTALAMGGIPLGAALGGFLVEGVGLRPTLLGMGAVYLVVTLSMFFNPVLREMNKRTQVADGASTQDKTG